MKWLFRKKWEGRQTAVPKLFHFCASHCSEGQVFRSRLSDKLKAGGSEGPAGQAGGRRIRATFSDSLVADGMAGSEGWDFSGEPGGDYREPDGDRQPDTGPSSASWPQAQGNENGRLVSMR